MTEPDWEAVADAAYSAYGLTTGGLNFRGGPMPDWADLPEKIREAWRTAAIAAALEAHGQLRDIIARARAALDAIPEPDLAWLAKLAALPESEVVTTSRVVALAVLDARAILAEAEPEDPEGGGGA